MRWHWLRLRATAHPTEDVARVQQAVGHLSALAAETFAKATQVTPITSHHGATLHLVETTIQRSRDIRTTLQHLVPDPRSLGAELDARTDDDGVLYLRFDKQAASAGAVVPSRTEDAVQVRLKPEVHPAGRERALAALQQWAAEPERPAGSGGSTSAA